MFFYLLTWHFLPLQLCLTRFHGHEYLSTFDRLVYKLNVFPLISNYQDFDFSAAVVQLKTLSSTLAVDEQLSNSAVEKTRVLQNILLYVVSVMYSFMELHSIDYDKLRYVDVSKYFFSRDHLHEVASSSVNVAVSEARSRWQQKSVVLVMEAGGVNWLVGKVLIIFTSSCMFVALLIFSVFLLFLEWLLWVFYEGEILFLVCDH